MPDQQNITNIPSNRVEFIDPRTGLVSREWYRFFLNLFNLAGAGGNQITLDEMQIGPPPQPDSGGGGGGSGSVTSVDVSGGTTGLTTTGGPITSSGTITLEGTLNVANGGTGATNATTARVNLVAAKSGANSDITSLDGVTGGISTPDYIDFDTAAAPARATGRLWWDNADGIQTLNLGMAGSNATMQIGEEIYFRIKASAAITEGQVVMFTGTVGASGALTGAPAAGLTASTAQYVMGVATESIAHNGWGYVTQFGLVRGIDTSGGAEAWVDGQILYYDPSVTGGLTKNLPSAPNAKVVVAAVIYASASNGSLFVRPSFGGELGQYEGNVGFGTLSNGDLMQYNSASGKWTNVPSTTFGTGSVTSVDTAGTVNGLTLTGGPITSSGTITLGGTLNLSSPPAIGGTTPAAGTFTTLTATGQTSLGGAAGSESFRATSVASAVNWVQVAGAATGARPTISSEGSDASVNLVVASKGSGSISLRTNTSLTQLAVSHTASAVNYVQVTGSATAGTPTISAQGSDTNVNLNITSKGSGIVFIGGQSSASSSTVRLAPSGGNAFFASSTNTSVNYLMASGAPTGTSPALIARGTDANVGIRIGALNTANIDFYASGDPNAGTGALQMRVAPTASAVNYVQVTGAATGGTPVISMQGSDANIGVVYRSKGTGVHIFQNSSGNWLLRVGNPTGTLVNYPLTFASVSGSPSGLQVEGTDTNIDLALTPKGTGVVRTSGTGIRLYGSSSGYVGLKGAAAAGSTTYTLPAADGTSGQSLSTNGSGTLSWATPASSNVTAQGLWENNATISSNYSITSGNNALSSGPVTVATGVTVTVPSGSVWTIV